MKLFPTGQQSADVMTQGLQIEALEDFRTSLRSVGDARMQSLHLRRSVRQWEGTGGALARDAASPAAHAWVCGGAELRIECDAIPTGDLYCSLSLFTGLTRIGPGQLYQCNRYTAPVEKLHCTARLHRRELLKQNY